MVEEAEKSMQVEKEFVKAKKEKASEVMKKQWEEQSKLKDNEKLINRIFV